MISFQNDYNFYLYNEDAELVADAYWHSRTGLKTWDASSAKGSKAQKVELAKFLDIRSNLLPDVLRRLLDRGLRIEIYSQDGKNWDLTQKATPGNLSEIQDILFTRDDMDSPAVMLAVKMTTLDGVRNIGVAFCDLILRKIHVAEFVDNEQLCNLEVRGKPFLIFFPQSLIGSHRV
jgi:DNA mismatch repair protein MSH2